MNTVREAQELAKRYLIAVKYDNAEAKRLILREAEAINAAGLVVSIVAGELLKRAAA